MAYTPFTVKMTEEQITDKLVSLYGSEVTTADIKAFCSMNDIHYNTVTRKLQKYKVSKGKWNLEVTQEAVEQIEKTFNAPSAQVQEKNLVPTKDETFVPFGGFRLLNGQTVWHNGPIIEALERGSILLLDEIDLASNKILCLQSILEGKGVFLKKIGRYVKPAPGFNVIATANTKGKGSEDGRFIGTNVLNEAFLERFALTFEQEYPTVATETKILEKAATSLAVLDKEFCSYLANWADIIRRTFNDGGVDEVISTRRLVHIVRAFAIWHDRMKAIKVCTNRFDDETKQSFIELYDKIDAGVDLNKEDDETV